MRAASSSSRCWSQSRPKTRSAMAHAGDQRRGAGTESLAHRDIVFDRQVYGRQLPPLCPGYRQRSLPDQVRCVGRNRIDVAARSPNAKRSAGRKRHVRYIRKAKPSVSKPGPRFALDAGTRTTVCANIKPDYIPAVRPGARRKPGGRFKRAAPGEPPSPMNPVSPLPAIGGNLAADGDLADAPTGSIGLALLQVGLHVRLRSDISRPRRQDNKKRKKAKP